MKEVYCYSHVPSNVLACDAVHVGHDSDFMRKCTVYKRNHARARSPMHATPGKKFSPGGYVDCRVGDERVNRWWSVKVAVESTQKMGSSLRCTSPNHPPPCLAHESILSAPSAGERAAGAGAGGRPHPLRSQSWVGLGTWAVATRRRGGGQASATVKEREREPTEQHHICPSIEMARHRQVDMSGQQVKESAPT